MTRLDKDIAEADKKIGRLIEEATKLGRIVDDASTQLQQALQEEKDTNTLLSEVEEMVHHAYIVYLNLTLILKGALE